MIRTPSCYVWLSLLATLLTGTQVEAQQYPAVDGRHYPLSQMTPPGTAAQWVQNLGRATSCYLQPVRVILPAEGKVTFYESLERPYELPAPAQAALGVGRMYRLKISDLADFPGVDFYPSIELIDRLHPPAGRADDFPVDFEFTTEELEWSAAGRLVTKVIYLEQPQRIPDLLVNAESRVTTIEPSRNALAEADQLGRPMAIVRLGGRTPDPNRPEPDFFGPGGPVRLNEPAGRDITAKRSRSQGREQFTASSATEQSLQRSPRTVARTRVETVVGTGPQANPNRRVDLSSPTNATQPTERPGVFRLGTNRVASKN